jgi:acyl-homoserine-lactone acylase
VNRTPLLLLLLASLAAGCAAAGTGPALGDYEATIRRTSYGVAHIRAADYGSLGFGEGYAQAEDHLCTIADQVVRVRGERARWFGRGEGDRHLLSDLGMRGLRVHERALEAAAASPPELRRWVEGFAAGYNLFLRETGVEALPGWCRGEPWVTPVTAQDLHALQRQLYLTATNFVAAMPAAQPPGAATALAPVELPGRRPTASNAWGIGRELSESGGGLLLANPHYPWAGASRFWEKHLVIPGELEVYGVSLLGVPGVQIGFNRHVGWSHTVSDGSRYTLYRVELVPGAPTRYRYGAEEREMTPVEVEVRVSGEAEPVRRTLWFTHYGPVVAPRGLEWSATHAFTLRDANEENFEAMTHWVAMGRAGSLREFQESFTRFQGLPWVVTVAAGADGTVWLTDASATPHLSPEALSAWLELRQRDPLTRQMWTASGAVLLDGSDPRFAWVDDPGARRPGIVPPQRLPQIERTDYVFNANDSFWLANPRAPLEGDYSPLHGEQRVPLSVRSRANALHLENRAPISPGGPDGRFTRAGLRRAVLGNHSLAAELLVPELVERCTAHPVVLVEGAQADLSGACRVLAGWDRLFDLESRGAALFREWLGLFPPSALQQAGPLFAVGFDPGDPVNTPRGLAEGEQVLVNLARAAALLGSRGIALDAPLGELQYPPSKLPVRLPVHGGNNWEGVLNLQQRSAGFGTLEPVRVDPLVPGSRFLTASGYPVMHGSSFLMVLELTAEGPRAEAVLTYGQSGDAASPHFTDQTELYARKEWRPVLFREAEIAADVQRSYTVRGRR